MDCGPACLQMIAGHYGRHYSLPTLREKSYLTRNGVSLLGISYAAESIGFRTQGARLTWNQLRDQTQLPCIVHWGKNHFVVVYHICFKRGKERVQVADPAYGRIRYTKEEFLKHWEVNPERQGIALLLEPTPEFYKYQPEQKITLHISRLLGYLTPYRRQLILLIAIMLLGSLISLVFPFLTQAVVDVGIEGKNLNIILVLFVAQLMLTLGQLGNELVRSWLMLHITTRIGISFISDFLNKLMRLPIAFFDVKMVGDIMQRITDNRRIQTFLTGALISIIISIITFIIYTIVIARYDLVILCIFLFGSFLYVGWVMAFLKRRRELDFRQFQEASANQSNLVQLVTGMQEIKLNNCEKQKRWEWERIQVELYKISVKSLALGQTQQVGGIFINQVKNILISYLAARAVINGEMTLGMMMAMQYVLGQLNAPLSQFIGFVQEAQDAKLSLERLGEIYNKEDEEPGQINKISCIPPNTDIHLQDVTFQYEGPGSTKVLNKINLTIEAGKITAIVGISGSGKTTLLKLLLGFYPPVSGSIKVGDFPLAAYSESAWRRNCGVVMQEGFIFSDTIAHNIGIVDEIPKPERLRHAAKVANIASFIDSLPLKYETKIGSEGNGLSAGQKQRILIARAVYRNPGYIFLDEATNSLDISNEAVIMNNLQQFYVGRTVVIVAHRLSTVRNADKIVVLDKGDIVESGTHEKLIRQRGVYYELIKNQLELGN